MKVSHIFFSICCIAIAVCSNAQSTSTDEVREGAYIEFKKTTHNFGTIIFGSDAQCEFTYTNTGNKPLIITNIKSSCGCTIPKWSKEELAPGQSNSIQVTYDSRRSGEFQKGITIYSNAANSTVILVIEGEVTHNTNKVILGEK